MSVQQANALIYEWIEIPKGTSIKNVPGGGDWLSQGMYAEMIQEGGEDYLVFAVGKDIQYGNLEAAEASLIRLGGAVAFLDGSDVVSRPCTYPGSFGCRSW